MQLLKYVGSKEKLVPEITKYIPKETTTVFEPFCGSASLSLSQDFSYYLTDAQPELINFLECVRDNPTALVEEIGKLDREDYGKEIYMAIRNHDRREDFLEKDPFVRAARYYFIIYRGFNGLYRVNKKNQANTPYGGNRKLPNDYKTRIFSASEHLRENCKGIFLQEFDNQEVLQSLIDSQAENEELFVFIDPPYYDTFDQYVPNRPDAEFWRRLSQYLEDLDQAGIKFLMTNSYKEFILDTFSEWKIDKIPITYSVAADGEKRAKTFEAFITNT